MTEPAPALAVRPRVLTPRQVETRARIVAAAVALAGRLPVDEFTMRDIAREAGVSPATAYTYFASREHLFAEVYADWVTGLTDRLRERPPGTGTALERVRAVLRRATKAVANDPDLARAFTRSMASADPSVQLVRPEVEGEFRSWLDIALEGSEVPERAARVRTLELAFYAAMISFTHGQLTVAGLQRAVDDAARFVIPA